MNNQSNLVDYRRGTNDGRFKGSTTYRFRMPFDGVLILKNTFPRVRVEGSIVTTSGDPCGTNSLKWEIKKGSNVNLENADSTTVYDYGLFPFHGQTVDHQDAPLWEIWKNPVYINEKINSIAESSEQDFLNFYYDTTDVEKIKTYGIYGNKTQRVTSDAISNIASSDKWERITNRACKYYSFAVYYPWKHNTFIHFYLDEEDSNDNVVLSNNETIRGYNIITTTSGKLLGITKSTSNPVKAGDLSMKVLHFGRKTNSW